MRCAQDRDYTPMASPSEYMPLPMGEIGWLMHDDDEHSPYHYSDTQNDGYRSFPGLGGGNEIQRAMP